MIYNMKDNKKEGVDLGLRQFIKSLGYVAGGTALLATTPWLTSCTPLPNTRTRACAYRCLYRLRW